MRRKALSNRSRERRAFKFKDTYGFPLEEILLIAKDTGLQVNLDSYQILEEKAKEKSRSAHTVHLQEIKKTFSRILLNSMELPSS